MLRTLTAVLFLILLPLHSSSAASLVTDSNNILIGATGINVNGSVYNVKIGDGTCAALFNGCDQNTDFLFQSQSTLESAFFALQQLIDNDARYATNPDSIAGCTNLAGCRILTPWSFVNATQQQLNITSLIVPLRPPTRVLSGPATLGDTAMADIYTYAVWTVPEPNTLMLLGIGLLGQRRLRPRGK